MKKIISGTMFLTLLLISMLTTALTIQRVRASGTIYIRPDGAIDPPTAPLQRVGDLYTFTDNIYDSIVVEKDAIVIDGNGYALQGTRARGSKGIDLVNRRNVLVKNTIIINFWCGICLGNSYYNTISSNIITNNSRGIQLSGLYSNYTDIIGNTITNNGCGIWLDNSYYNTISGNIITNSTFCGIYLQGSKYNSISGNNFVNDGLFVTNSYRNVVVENFVNGKPLVYLEDMSNYSINIENAGQVILVSCKDMIVENISLSNTFIGIQLCQTNKTTIARNTITDNKYGIYLDNSYYNSITGNDIANNRYGGVLTWSSNNNIVGNVFTNDGLVSYSYQNFVKDNTVNGKPLVYLEGVTDYSVGKAGQVILVGCERIRVENLDLSRTIIGVQLFATNHSIISGNTITNNFYGIDLFGDSNIINGNTIANNQYGISFSGVCNIISNNIITNNSHGIELWGDCSNIINGNTIANNQYGLWLPLHAIGDAIYHNNFINNTLQVGSLVREYMNWAWDDGYPSGGNYWSDYTGVDYYSGPNQDIPGSDGIGDAPYILNEYNRDRYPLMKPWSPVETWAFDSDFQYNLNDNYHTVEGSGHICGTATLADSDLLINGEVSISGQIPSQIPTAYLIATDGLDREYSRQIVDLNQVTYIQTGPNTYTFQGKILNAIKPVNKGHYEVEAQITYNNQQYEFFINTNSRINNHYLPLTTLPPPPPKFKIGDWVQTAANLNVREGPGLGYAVISTMPGGTLGQIAGGSIEADGYVWWNVDYALDYVRGVKGWSAENWLGLCQLPLCVIKLQKDGSEINGVSIGEFFDIYVGSSTGPKQIRAVRFSSDGVQDGIPTGEWTEWFSWDLSSGDWDATTKIKRWAFATPGYKEVWAEIKDEMGKVATGSATIFVPAPALPVLTSPLVITPVKTIYNVGDILEAEFTIKNVGDIPITLDILTVGGRFNDGKLSDGKFPDFPFHSITLQPHESYQYQGSLTLTQAGNYHFFIAYHIENPTPEEKRLLDENNWNTNIELGPGLTHKDRVKNIVVLEEIDMLKLEESINRWKNILSTYQYPPNLLDDKSFSGRVSKIWAKFTSFATRTGLTEKYKELYFAGVEYHRLSYQALLDAENSLQRGDIEDAKKYLERSYTYSKLSAMSFSGATEVYEANLNAGIILAKSIRDGCEAVSTIGLSVLCPPAATKVDALFSVIDFAVDYALEGKEQAIKNIVAKIAIKLFVKEEVFRSFDYDTLEDFANLVGARVSLDEILTNEEFLEGIGAEQLYKVLRDKLLMEGVELTLSEIYGIRDEIISRLKSLANSIKLEGKSPIEVRIIDQEGKITGVVNGVVKHEIPMSLYYNGTITVYFPTDFYLYEVAGIEHGSYGLEITSLKDGEITTFIATDIPISTNAIHQYTINWTALSLGEEGVTVQVDSDGDGVFERIFTSDGVLNHDGFVLQTKTTVDFDPNTLNLGSKGKWITAYIEFPEGYDVAEINISTILLNGSVPVDFNAPAAIGDYDGDGFPDLLVKFDRVQVTAHILANVNMAQLIEQRFMTVTLTIIGKLDDGTPFQGTNTIKIVLLVSRYGRMYAI